MYTRDGTFDFDASGKFFDPGPGLAVQGNLANADGSFKSEKEDLIMPLDRESEAKATTRISLSGNLNASGTGSGDQVWTSTTEFGKPARLSSGPNPVFPLDLSVLASGGLKVSVNESGTLHESTLSIPTKSYGDRLELVSELNSLINANGTLKNRALFKTNDLGELILRTVNGGEAISIAVDNSDPTSNVVTLLGFVANSTQQGQRAADTDLLNELANVGEDLSDRRMRFSGVKPNGERLTVHLPLPLEPALRWRISLIETAAYPPAWMRTLRDPSPIRSVAGGGLRHQLRAVDQPNGSVRRQTPFEFSTNTQVCRLARCTHGLQLRLYQER